jgi:membrane-bound metal-dependent hydrolase YbcI (DUF457 family)
MNVVEHFLIGWCIASIPRDLTLRERGMITFAAVAPDVDGLGMLVELPTRNTSHPLFWWTNYHHIIAHNMGAAILMTAITFVFAKRRWLTSTYAFLAFHSHIVGDVIGARGPDGYQWPIPYFLPFSREPELAWAGQWALNAWQNFVITGCALMVTLFLAWRRGYSPVRLFSPGADRAFIEALRNRFPSPAG